MQIDRENMDIAPGCEAAAQAMLDWINAVETENFDLLEDIIDERYQMTCLPFAKNGRFNKAEFIELDRHIRDATMNIIGFTARKCEDIVITQIFAIAKERLVGDLGPDMPPAEELAKHVGSSPMAYATMWKADDTGQWRCMQHHVFGPVGQYSA